MIVPCLIVSLLCSNLLLRIEGKSLLLCSEEFLGLTYMAFNEMNVFHSFVNPVV